MRLGLKNSAQNRRISLSAILSPIPGTILDLIREAFSVIYWQADISTERQGTPSGLGCVRIAGRFSSADELDKKA